MMNKKGDVEFSFGKIAGIIIIALTVIIITVLAYQLITGKGSEILSIFD